MLTLQLTGIDKLVAGTQAGDRLFFYCKSLSESCARISHPIVDAVRKMRDVQFNIQDTIKILRRMV